MLMSALPQHEFWTVDDYIQFDDSQNENRYEYQQGKIYAMAGASRRHGIISLALASMIYTQLLDRPCQAFQGEMRVQVTESNYFYPDIVVVCGKEVYKSNKENILLNPTVVIEILSPSTEDFDRGRKFALYRQNPSLQAYLLVSQDEIHIESYVRMPDNQWLLTDYNHADAEISLKAIDCHLKLADVYRKVDFEQADDEAI